MKKIYVTKPYVPVLEEYHHKLQKIWSSAVLTNMGQNHQELEEKLCVLFNSGHTSLVNNGTIALELAIQALELKGRVITTPYSFVATANSILLKGLEPIFIDIEDNGFNLDPELIEDAMMGNVSAVMPVHVYGTPCDDQRISKFAKEKSLKVIYDAAHSFGIKKEDKSILSWGDISTLSFHATKVYHTFEGGALSYNDADLKQRIAKLRNFGIESDGDVKTLGTNAKMNEAQAAMGLVLLDHLEKIIELRKKWHDKYVEQLENIEGIRLLDIPNNIEYNFSYFPILVQKEYPLTRDELFDKFTKNNIFPRKYFYPLITDFSLYKNYKIISKHNVPNARRVADSVMCLPLYPDLTENDVDRVCDVILAEG